MSLNLILLKLLNQSNLPKATNMRNKLDIKTEPGKVLLN